MIAHPGSRIDGSLRPLQKDVINIGQGRNNVERMRLKQLMEKVNGRKHAAGVRSQTSLLPSSYSAEQDAEPVVSKEINVGSVKACCGYETGMYYVFLPFCCRILKIRKFLINKRSIFYQRST